MVFAPYVVEEQVAKLEIVFTRVRYIFLNAQLKKDKLWYINASIDSSTISLGKTEDYYITLHTYSYSKTSNWCRTRNK